MNRNLLESLADHGRMEPGEAARLLSLTLDELAQDEAYQALLAQLDQQLLSRTLHDVRKIYDSNLAEFKREYDLQDTVMGGHTLGNWVLGYLMYPDQLHSLADRHVNVPTEKVQQMLLDLLSLLQRQTGEGCREWQRALALLTLPLLAET